MKNKITLLVLSSTLISFPAVGFAITCYTNTGTPQIFQGTSCPPSTSETRPDNIYTQTNPIEQSSGQTSGSVSAPTQSSQTSGSLPAPTKSTTGRTQTISLPNPLGAIKTIPELIGRLVDWLIFIASVAVLPAMIIWGAYQLLTAGGNSDAVTSARHTITWAVVGYALLLISKGIEFIIRDVLTRGA